MGDHRGAVDDSVIALNELAVILSFTLLSS